MAYTTINRSTDHFRTKLYAGNSTGSRAITFDESANMKPDFVWIKERDDTINHYGFDSVRGVTKGLSQNRIMIWYAAKNAILPIITSFGMAIGFILNGTILTEIIFSYPGQGYILFQAVQSQDFQLMQGIFLTITLSVLLVNWLVDILVLFLDPRTRK